MSLTGRNFIGPEESALSTETFRAYSTRGATEIGPEFYVASEDEVNRAVELAARAAVKMRPLPASTRADFLEAIASGLLDLGDQLVERACSETALPPERINGERQRTVGQLAMFASMVRDGSWVDAVVDTAIPDRKPAPRPDLRRMLVSIGPVAVFGASNFPLAFSVPGGDTASAIAAGCPVVIKAHPAHPGVSELTFRAILDAAEKTGMPPGCVSMLHGGASVGSALVRHPSIKAVAFTGSHAAGRALFDLAAGRPEPIPVFAEMGSVNPVFVLPAALSSRGDAIAASLAQSFTLGVGQFCTSPGIVFGVKGAALDSFVETAARSTPTTPMSMLTRAIADAFDDGKARISGIAGVAQSSATGAAHPSTAVVYAAVYRTDLTTFLSDHRLSEEVFGPVTLIVEVDTPSDFTRVAERLGGQLTATVHADDADIADHADLISILEQKAGRIVFNGFPTGVEVCASMQHGGPYPASTDSRFTSVGTAAIARFARPVCWQNAPDHLLPTELRNANRLGIRRLVDGVYTQGAIA